VAGGAEEVDTTPELIELTSITQTDICRFKETIPGNA